MHSEILDSPQYYTFKDCVARRFLARSDIPESTSDDADCDALDDFTSYLAAEAFPFLPKPLTKLWHGDTTDIDADTVDLNSIPPSFTNTLVSYGLADDEDNAHYFLRKVLEQYIRDVCAPLPAWSSTRATECQICEREIPLTYHHLIPRSTHTKVLKRKWHPEYMLNSVAWLCRYCHSTVHGVTSNEDLARNFYTVELLLAREDIQKWKRYAARQRYGKRRG